MTKIRKINTLLKIKVWAVLDKNDRLVGAHHGKKYIADMNALFVEEGKIVQGYIVINKPKQAIKKKKR